MKERSQQSMFPTVLIVVTILTFAALVLHPAVGGEAQTDRARLFAALYAARDHLAVMHGTVLLALLVTWTAILGFCNRLGFARPLVLFGALFFSAGTLPIAAAGFTDGFLLAQFAAPHIVMGGSVVDMGPAIAAGAIFIQVATKFGIAMYGISILLLSWHLIGIAPYRRAAFAGIVLGVVQLALLYTVATLRADNIAIAALPLLIWQIIAASVWRLAERTGAPLFDPT